mmetsp:Transcript_38165/g.56242  ORF Transcript_38165/g.56242 Transcript_38165/m.56242 type:complete len:165 (-) Transcript_38165:79-573(-)
MSPIVSASDKRTSSKICLASLRFSLGNVSSTNSTTLPIDIKQPRVPTKLGKMKGNDVNISFNLPLTQLECGYCSIGSESTPLIAGHIKKPQPHMPITNAIERVSNFSSPCAISDTKVLTVPTIPLLNPNKHLIKIAHLYVRQSPKHNEKIPEKAREAIRTKRRP